MASVERGAADAATRTLTGHLLGHDGVPMQLAEVHYGDQTATAGADGRYQITIPATGMVRVTFSGVDHAIKAVPIFDRGAVALDVTLGTYPRKEPTTKVTVCLMSRSENGNQFRKGQRTAMQIQRDGTWLAKVDHPDGDLMYELEIDGVSDSINGTQSNAFSFDGSDYASHVTATGGSVMIRFDPRKLPPASRPASISFAHASHTQTELAALDRELAAPPTALAARREALERALAAEHDPIIRGALLVTFFAVPDQLDLSSSEIRELTARLIAAVPADSDLWELWPQALSRATAVSPDPAARDYAERGAHALSDRSRAASVIFTLAYNAKLNGRNADITRLYRDLVANYAGTMESRNARIFDPDRKIRVGQPVPAFDLPSLDDPHKRITREGLPGKFVLFDFWATWCHPCMEEMPRLHAAYKAFRSRGLSIISIDANEPNEVVKAFRKAKWPMPWQHAVNADDVATKTFDVAVFPTAILVDPTGTIVAVDEDLLGDRLAKTLERVLGHT